LFTGRRNSYTLINGFVYVHPSAITILFSAFLPLSIGFLLTLFKSKLKNIREYFHIISALIIVLCCVFAYSFIVGADQFGRYFLICISFFLLAGFYGLEYIYSYFKDRNSGYLNVLIALLIIFLFLANAYDYYKRVVNIEQIESNIYEIFFAPSMRGNLTSEALKKYGYDTNDTIKLAITEVQYKYFVDGRVRVISLDGRSSPKILKYMNENGLPDFEKFIENEKPDIVEVKGWPYRGNLLYDWEEKINGMKIGESFNWKSNTVTYISRWHVKILYNTNR
jgi:hypothetical protein